MPSSRWYWRRDDRSKRNKKINNTAPWWFEQQKKITEQYNYTKFGKLIITQYNRWQKYMIIAINLTFLPLNREHKTNQSKSNYDGWPYGWQWALKRKEENISRNFENNFSSVIQRFSHVKFCFSSVSINYLKPKQFNK